MLSKQHCPPRKNLKSVTILANDGVAEQLKCRISSQFVAASKRQSSVARSNRLFSVNLAHYVTVSGHSDLEEVEEDDDEQKSDSSDGDLHAVTMDENADVLFPLRRVPSVENVQMSIRTSLLASNGLRFNSIVTKQQDEIIAAMLIRTIEPGTLIVKKGDSVEGIVLVISEGTAVSDTATGEWFSRGKLFNAESIAFAQHISPYTLRAGDSGAVIAVLPTSKYQYAQSLRTNYLRSKYSILDTLSNSSLKHFHPDHHWVNAKEEYQLHNKIALMTHGVSRMKELDNSERMFPGQTIGVCELMQGSDITLVAETFVGCAVISDTQFAKFMRQRLFMDAINEITYQRSVVLENFRLSPIDVALIESSEDQPAPITFTSRLCKTYDEKGVLTINQYKVIQKIGSGATAAVFKVTDETICKHRVMKIVKRKDSEKSLQREIHALTTLVHPNVIRAYDIIDCTQASVVILVQELADWGSLLSVVLPMQETKACAVGCIRALKHVHKAGLIHGDIKPANILRNRHGQIKLADFGCTTHVDDPPEARPRGTPAFMAPEVLENKACQSSDIWAFTISLYCLLYGTVPFHCATTKSLKEAILYSEIPLQHHGSGGDEMNFTRLCERGLAKDPTKRISLEEFEEDNWMRQNPPRHSLLKIQRPSTIEAKS